jgi:DNA repair protein RadC
MNAPRLKSFPPSERPRERCLERGARCLSLRELLALLIHTGPPGIGALGLAALFLDRPGAGLGEREQERALFTALESSSDGDDRGGLSDIRGLGPAARARVLAAFELGRRYAHHRETVRGKSRLNEPMVRGSRLFGAAAARISPEFRQEPREWLGFVPLYRSGELGELCLVERGVRTHINIEPAELFARILALRPQSFFLFHNHPSGNLTPSLSDRELTENVAALARTLGMRLLGHAVVTSAGETWIDVLS